MTAAQFQAWPPLLRARHVLEAGVPKAVLDAVAEPVSRSDQEVAFGRIGYIVLPSVRAHANGPGRRLYLKTHVARFLGKEFQ